MQRLLLTPGEPAGVGPDITVQLAQRAWPVEVVAIADPALLAERAKLLNLPLTLIECDETDLSAGKAHTPGTLFILPTRMAAPAQAGVLNTANAPYVIRTLEMAAALCLQQKAKGVVTGPVHKEIINQAGIAFTGHTEFFAHFAGAAHTVMLFVVDNLKVALATTHLPLAQVPAAITRERLQLTLSILQKDLQTKFNIPSPNILVCGLNPHAGEGGYLGREEIDTITPALDELRAQGYQLQGPLPADTIFTPSRLQSADAVLAMYHDQALPVVKHIGFDRAVNVTLGLPFIRTSVDHGTAIDKAGTPQVDAGSMLAAMQLAVSLCN